MLIREQALRSSREQRKSLYITSKSDKTNMEIKLWGSSNFVPSHAHQTRSTARKPWQGDMHVKGYIQRMLSATFRDENLNLSRIHISSVVDLISDWSATCGLNFRLQLQAAHSELYHFYLFSPVALLWILSFRSPDVLLIFWWRSCFADVLFCSLTIFLCVLVFKPWLDQKSGLVCSFSSFLLFFHPSLFFGGFPLSQRFFPRSSFQLHVGRAAGNVIWGAFCSFRCVASCQIVVWGGFCTLDLYFEVRCQAVSVIWGALPEMTWN